MAVLATVRTGTLFRWKRIMRLITLVGLCCLAVGCSRSSSGTDTVTAELAKLADGKTDRVNLAKAEGIDDESLRPLKDFAKKDEIRFLLLNETLVGDMGLQELPALPKLRDLDLTRTMVSNQGLDSLRKFPGLTFLSLYGCSVDDRALDHVARLIVLDVLVLGGTQVTNVGLEKLKALSRLVYLNVDGTAVSKKGLDHLTGLKRLRKVSIRNTKVTPDEVVDLRRNAPNWQIVDR